MVDLDRTDARADWDTATPPALPDDYESDDSITDFASLRASVYRLKDYLGPELGTGALPVFGMLGELDAVREDAREGYVDEQRESGLFPAALDSFRLYRRSFMTLHELFIAQRDDLSGCVHLGRRPPHELRYLEALTADPSRVESWIESLPWRDPWATGNLDMDLAYALAVQWKVFDDEGAREALEVWFDWHDRHADPETGFWDPMDTGNVYSAMAGAMHQFGIYFTFGREVPYPERVIEATAGLQQPTGLFCPYHYSHNCADVDAVFVLANLHNRHGHRPDLVESTLREAFEANLRCFHPAGGAVSRVGVDEEPDWWSTWCRVAIVGWCARLLDVEAFRGPWDFRPRHPFLSEDAGVDLPDWRSDAWAEAAGWGDVVAGGSD